MLFLTSLIKNIKKRNTASLAKKRLQIILACERNSKDSPEFLPKLQYELLDVVSKYIPIKINDIKVNLERQENLEVLDIKIEVPIK